MSYQVNLNQNTSVYVNKNEKQGILEPKADSADKADGSVQAATEADEGLMQAVNGGEDVVRTTSTQFMKNTEQYMDMLERNGSTAEGDDVESEEEAKERKKEIYRNLSSEEIAKLKMMQIDLSAVSLSDIAGLVNAIRSEAHQQEFDQKIADICDGIDAIRGKITHENLKDTLKSLLPEEMHGLAIDSVLEEGYEISEQQMIYLLKNELQLTISNLYKSEYATSSGVNQSQPKGLDADALKLLEPQIDSVIRQSGIEAAGRDVLTAAAHFMIEHDIPLTPASLRNYVAIQELNAHGMETGVVAANMLLQEAYGGSIEAANVYFDQRTAAKQLKEEVAALDGEAVAVAERGNMAVTIHNLAMLSEASETGKNSDSQKDDLPADVLQTAAAVSDTMEDNYARMSKAQLTARRQLEEIRLSMTQSAAYRMVMLDIHIDTRELADVVKQLREMELVLTRKTFRDYGMKYRQEQGELYRETMQKVEGIKQMPAAILGIAVRPEPLTVNSLYEQGTRWFMAKTAQNSYEALMTAPRSDMGDAISKAFARVDTLLSEMQVEVSEENRRAARILGYNQMEITEESLAAIRDADARVQQMLRQMTPRAVLGLIRRGENPLEMSVDELNTVLQENEEDTRIQDDEKYSEFLYKLEQKKDITREERESYIGIFRLLHKISKHSGRDIGSVVKEGKALTLKNLLSAHRSNQAKGMDFTASDETGAIESVTVQGVSISEQIEQAFMQYGEPVVTQVFEEMQAEMPDTYAEELYEEAGGLPESEEAWSYLEEQESVISQGNLQAAAAMLTEDAGIYGMIEKWLAHAKGGSTDREADVEEAYTEELPSDMEALFTDVARHFDGKEAVLESYEAIAERLGEMSRTELTGVLTHQDIQSLKQIHTGFSLLRREAEQESFQIPVQADGKWTLMHVRFVDREQEAGSITFSMEHERLGMVSASIVTGAQAGGEIRTAQGALDWSPEILERAEQARDKADQYALAKDIFRLLARL